MKPIIQKLVLGATLSAAIHLQAAPTLVTNGDFETPGGASWAEISGGGTYAYSYPVTGGNPNGCGVIDHSADDGGFGIWVAADNQPITLASLGLTAGEAYRFSQDMKILSGTKLGGFKVDFFTGTDIIGSTGDIFPDLMGDGSSWETYSFKVPILAAADGVKIVPLWGAGSTIGYDNVCVDPTPIFVPPIPNGDFEDGSANWFEMGAPNTTFSYPESGGNPDRYGVMTNNGGGTGSWVANGGAPLALSSLGISGGDVVTFMQDMILLTGSNVGGLKIEYFQGPALLGDSGNLTPDLIGNGSTWETYSFEVTLPATADHIKFVPIWGLGSSVGFDNFTFTVSVPPPFAMDVTLGTAVSWTPPSEANIYQPQKSDNGLDWVNLGSPIAGNAIMSAFEQEESPFYRVLETPVGVSDVILNGGFESPDPLEPTHAESWTGLGSQPPTRITSDFRSGSASMKIRAVNNASPAANNSEIQQNISDAGGSITPGNSYDFSFWAKQVTSGVSYVQQYRVNWLEAGGAILPGGVEFTSFAGGFGDWVEISAPGLVAPEGAETALIQIFGATGAVAGSTAQGEVLIDDLSLVTASAGPSTIEAILNGDHELLDVIDFTCSESWICVGTQPPTNIASDSLSGIASMELMVQNDGTATPNSSEIRQDIADAGGSIMPGATYDFSFWAKELLSGVSYVQQYRLRWLNGAGATLPGSIDFTSFTAASDEWTEIAVQGLVAPQDAVTAVIEIVASTGAVAGSNAEGVVLIDVVSLAARVMPDILPASAAPGVQISWGTEAGNSYQLKCSSDLNSFSNFGPSITGDGGMLTATDVISDLAKFYQVVETAP